MTVECTRLKSGLTVVTETMPHLESVALGVWIKSGSRNETEDEHGIAHLKNWASPRRHHGRREYMRDIIQAVAALLSHQQAFTLASDERV